MRKITAVLLLIFLVSCASPAPQSTDAPIPSPTLTPVVVVTQKPKDTQTIEPTVTSTAPPTETIAPKPPEIALNFSEPDKLPGITAEDFASDAFATRVMERSASGVYPAFSPDVVIPAGGIELVSKYSALLGKYGQDQMFSYVLDASEKKAWNHSSDAKPWMVVERWQINDIPGAYGMVIKIPNPIGKDGFYRLIDVVSNKDVAAKLSLKYDRKNPGYTLTATFFRSVKDCRKRAEPIIGQSTDVFCAVVGAGEIPKSIRQWAATGILDNMPDGPDGRIEIPTLPPSGNAILSE